MLRSPAKVIFFKHYCSERSSQALLRRPECYRQRLRLPPDNPARCRASDHDLFVTAFAIAIIAKRHDIPLRVGAFNVATGNIIERQMPILEIGKETKEGSALTSKQIGATLVKCTWMSWQNLYQTIFCFTGQTHLTGLKTLSMNFANLTPVCV